MSNQSPRCPVCHNEVAKTRGNNIGGHLDKSGQPCPVSYAELPFDKALHYDKPRCPAEHLGNRCQLQPGHHGDHRHITKHTNAVHELVWTDEIDQLRRRT